MSGTFGGPPDPFSLSPLLALLPQPGKIARLESLVSSLFARHEKVEALRNEEVDADDDGGSQDRERRYAAEAAMLRQILDWLALKPTASEE
jgi:hypothetical protein